MKIINYVDENSILNIQLSNFFNENLIINTHIYR